MKKDNILSFIKERPYFGYFSLLFFLLFSAIMINEIALGKFEVNDFKVYYSAAQNYWNGDTVYGIPFGLDTGYYKYSPVILLCFSPFTLLPYTFAAAIYYIINLIAIVYLFYRFIRLVEAYFPYKRKLNFLILMVIQLSFIGHFLRELHLGNTNLLLLLGAVISIDLVLKNKAILSGILLSILILTKPYFGLLLLPFVLIRKYSIGFSWVCSTLALFLISILFFGLTGSMNLHYEWLISMNEHSNYLSSNNTIFHIFDFIFNTTTSLHIGLPAFTGFAIITLLVFLFKQKGKSSFHTKDFIVFFFILLAIFPNFLVTDTEHFLFSFGLISLLAIELFERRSKWLWIPYILLIIFYLGETNLFVSRNLFDQIKQAGGMGLANIVLISWSLYYIYFQTNSTNSDQKNSIPEI